MQIRFRIVTHPVLVYCWSYWPLPLAQAIQTHCLNQFGFLSLNYKLKDIDQLCCDKKRKDCGSPWSIQMHTFWCNSKRWRILAPNRTKLISLLSLLPAWWIPMITCLELFWSCFSYALVLLPRLFALVANFDGQVYVICCFVPYICTGGELWCPVDVICVIAVIG